MKEFNKIKISFYIGISVLLVLFFIELISILRLNNGMLTYTLDDPYIHMALSENIMHGHYGINANEPSAPSSSILWPFIIAPFSHIEWFPLAINFVFSIISIFIFTRILHISFNNSNKTINKFLTPIITLLIILSTNIVGIAFTGMEHSLQLLLTVLILYGIINEIENSEIPLWFIISITIAPLVRYECFAISTVALLYLFKKGYFKQAIIASTLLFLFVGSFSLFLISLGLNPFPTSVSVKSTVVQSGGQLYTILRNLKDAILFERQGRIMFAGIITLAWYIMKSQDDKRKPLALAATLAILMHFVAGRFGWYHRYEIYILSFMLLTLIYLLSPFITKYVEKQPGNFIYANVIIISLFTIIGIEYVRSLFSLPIAANNIYEQQYQMHRFAVQYYNEPVAVNDLGYVSYKNSNYILDLWGLGSEEAFHHRKNDNDSEWMSVLCKEKSIGLVMIYENWFDNIPNEWILAGTLNLSRARITPASSKVNFYATNPANLKVLKDKLHIYTETLPPNVVFNFQQNY